MRDERIPDFRPYCIPLSEKRNAMKKIVLVATAFAVMSCGLEEVGGRPDDGAGDVWVKPGTPVTPDDSEKTVIYVTAMDYPDGYDWRVDKEKGSVKCSLVVFADGIPVMKVPVGDSYEVSSDPDMHRMAGGHLYTDYSTDNETVIKKDGKEIIRYPGREMICGLVVKDEDVYTLGHPRRGDGFTYRKNGEILIERERGRSFGRLYNDGEDICFAFREPIGTVGEALERYYYVRNGEISQTAVREDVKKVWDIVSCDGDIIYLATVVGVSSPVLFRSGGMQALEMPGSAKMLTCRIVSEDGAIYVEGLCSRENKPLTSGLWDEGGNAHIFADGMTVSSICMAGNGVCCIMNGASSYMRGTIYRCGETFSMPLNYSSIGSSPAIVIDGILHVGLSSLVGSQPLIWKDAQTTPLKINGYISTISTNK